MISGIMGSISIGGWIARVNGTGDAEIAGSKGAMDGLKAVVLLALTTDGLAEIRRGAKISAELALTELLAEGAIVASTRVIGNTSNDLLVALVVVLTVLTWVKLVVV
jgi:hypothetical protein